MTFGIAWAQTSAPPASPPADGGTAAAGFFVIIGLLVVVGIAVKLYDRKRKRDAEAVHLQAQVSDALMRDARLAGLVPTPTAQVPMWGKGSAMPDASMRELVLRVTRDEATRIRPDVQIVDRISVRQMIAA